MIERRLKKRYALALPGAYLSPCWIADGELINISSSGLLFRAIDRPPEEPAGLVKVELNWPAVLGDGARLRMRVRGRVVRSDGREIAVLILGHGFYVRGWPLGRIA